VHADAVRLVQVITSLLENAAKYTGEGGEIWLDEFATATEVCVRVRDNGAGMPPELLPGVFDLFSAASAAGQSRKSGLGLSLPVARELIGLHQGRIEASSAGPGKGSAFVIFLPALSTQSDAVAAISGSGENARAPQPMFCRDSPRAVPGSVKRVLIADDNAALRESLCNVIRDMGHEVKFAADGAQAVDVASRWLPEFVLLDVNMPGLDGFAAARELRAAFPPATMKLVLMSGDFLNETTLSNAKQAGFDHCIDKIDAFAAIEKLLESGP
jgi:CheY-like chemotaxis protein